MMLKRGQIAIFIIIAVVVIGAVAIFFVLREKKEAPVPFTPETAEIYSFVEDCIGKVGSEVVSTVGSGGGYFFPPELSTATGIPYYYSDGKNYMPSKRDVEEEISYYVNAKLFFCTENFVDFPEFDVSQGEIKTSARINDNSVLLNVEYPLSIAKAGGTSTLKDFEDVDVPVRLGIVYDSISEIIREQLAHDDICLSCISEVTEKNDLYIDMLDYDKETTVFIVKDENSKINGKSFEFVFANKYAVGE